jgi:hypothetical protein
VDCSHEWLWTISPHKGKMLSNEDFALAVRIRLGAGGPDEDVACANCGDTIIGPAGTHGLLCARGIPLSGQRAHMASSVLAVHFVAATTPSETKSSLMPKASTPAQKLSLSVWWARDQRSALRTY